MFSLSNIVDRAARDLLRVVVLAFLFGGFCSYGCKYIFDTYDVDVQVTRIEMPDE